MLATRVSRPALRVFNFRTFRFLALSAAVFAVGCAGSEKGATGIGTGTAGTGATGIGTGTAGTGSPTGSGSAGSTIIMTGVAGDGGGPGVAGTGGGVAGTSGAAGDVGTGVAGTGGGGPLAGAPGPCVASGQGQATLPGTFYPMCSGCHSAFGAAANPAVPNLFTYASTPQGTQAAFVTQVRSPAAGK